MSMEDWRISVATLHGLDLQAHPESNGGVVSEYSSPHRNSSSGGIFRFAQFQMLSKRRRIFCTVWNVRISEGMHLPYTSAFLVQRVRGKWGPRGERSPLV